MITKNSKFLYQFFFLFFLIYQSYYLYTFNSETRDGRFWGISLGFINVEIFDFFIFLGLVLAFIYIIKLKHELVQNRSIINLIFFYILYQTLIILPYSILIDIDKPNKLFVFVISRYYFILIPVFYWFLYPEMRNISTLFAWINISSLLLLLAGLKNYGNGSYFLTNTGEIRLLYGGAALVYVFVFFTNFFVKNRNLLNYFFICTSIVGIIFTNHRSAYVYFLLVIFLGLWFKETGIQRLKILMSAFILSLAVLAVLSTNDFLWSSMTGRMSKTEIKDENAQDRFERWELSFDYFLENPVNGALLKDQYYSDSAQGLLDGDYAPHNFVLEILSSQGLVGFLFYIGILIKCFQIGFQNRKDPISYQMLLSVSFYALFCSFNANFLVKGNVLILVLCISILLYRNKILHANESALVH